MPPKPSKKANQVSQAQPRGSARLSLQAQLLPIALLLLAAAASPISQLTLAPVFGAIPSAVNHSTAILGTFLVGVCLYIWKPDTGSSNRTLQFLAVWTFWVPVIQSILLPYSLQLGPVGGPVLNGFLSCHTLLIPTAFGFAAASDAFRILPVLGEIPRIPRILGLGLLALTVFGQIEKRLTEPLAWGLSLSRSLTPIHLQLLHAACFAALAPSRWLSLAVPAVIYTATHNPHINLANTNQALDIHNWTLLDRAWSNTGYISVLQSQNDIYRVLRCDHSLLGGEWLLTPERASKEGWRVNEPIYAAFEMLEAVRLLQPPHRAEGETSVPDTSAQALVIGLGIGTAPKAFLNHGINTTIVELDPVVHRFATEWFDLPANHTAVLQDAVGWVAEQARIVQTTPAPAHAADEEDEKETTVQQGQRYDYIIHDVFTGGAEPLALFNTAFLRNLRTLLSPQGNIALNYAGDLSLPLTRLVLNTISHAFAGQCKIFRDAPPEKHADANNDNNTNKKNRKSDGGNADPDQDFLNMVVFCRNSDGPISFRKPRPADFLGSLSRQHYLLPKPEMEIPFPRVSSSARSGDDTSGELLEPGDEEAWASVQAESARRHWRIMRTVVPDAVWELW